MNRSRSGRAAAGSFVWRDLLHARADGRASIDRHRWRIEPSGDPEVGVEASQTPRCSPGLRRRPVLVTRPRPLTLHRAGPWLLMAWPCFTLFYFASVFPFTIFLCF